MTTETEPVQTEPVQGPAQPTEADLLWATGLSRATLADLPVSSPVRTAAIEAEAAVYQAAKHMGIDDREPDLYQQYTTELAELEAE